MEAEISALLDGELAAPEAAAVEAHVRTCPACANLARDLAAVGRTLRSAECTEDGEVPAEPVSPAFRAKVLSRTGAGRRRQSPYAPGARGEHSPLAREATGDEPGAVVPAIRYLPGRARLLRWLPAAAAAASFAAVLATGAILGRVQVLEPNGTPAPASPGPASSAPTAQDLLALAGRHRAEGRSDLERRALVAAWGLAPADAGVREACVRGLGFDPSVLDSPGLDSPGLEAPVPFPAVAGSLIPVPEPGAATAAGGLETPGLQIGTLHFESTGAYDAFTAFHEWSAGLEMELALRGEARPRDTVTTAAIRTEPERRDPLSRALGSLTVGAPVGGDGTTTYQGIVVFPLRATAPEKVAAVLTLPEALESAKAEVLENPGRGESTVLVSNLDAGRPLLVLAGDVLRGGRADRMVARDVLVPAGSRGVPVPVYDVMAVRGASRTLSYRFRQVAGVGGARLRGMALAQVPPEDLRKYMRGRLSVLGVASLKNSLAEAYSDRGAAAPLLRALRPSLGDLVKGLQAPDVLGFAVAQGPEVLGIEVFGSHELLLKSARRILEGCAVEAATYRSGGPPPSREAVAAMLAAAGAGTAIRGTGTASAEVGVVSSPAGLLGSGVARGDGLVHASVLPGTVDTGAGRRDGKSGDSSDGGERPAGGSGSGEGTPPGSGGSSGGGEGDPAGSGSGSGSKPSDPPPPTGDRPK
jgi:hypothetical protein